MGSPPSNGTMGMMWTGYWCDHCRKDHRASHIPESNPLQEWSEGCELLGRMYMSTGGEEFPELIDHDYDHGDGWHPRFLECRMFDRCPCDDDPGWEPTPAPVPDPNQGLLFEVVDDSPAVPGGAVLMGAPFDSEDRIVGALKGRLIAEGPSL